MTMNSARNRSEAQRSTLPTYLREADEPMEPVPVDGPSQPTTGRITVV